MKKTIIALSILFCGGAIWSYGKMKQAQKEMEADLTLTNIEALASNETGTTSTCEVDCTGLLGICRYDCKYCGVHLHALGSGIKVTHKCNSIE